jgi:pimeloyl-ACP methyl ester carboxylesterase
MKKPTWPLRLAIFLILYIAVLALAPLPDRLVLFPTTSRIDAGAAVRKTIPFQNGELEVWTAQSAMARLRRQPDVYILRFYGNADRADRWVAPEADMWNNRAVEVWGMNYPGFGGSTGPARLAKMGPAALTAFDDLQKVAGGRPVVVYGASIGTATALHIAANRKFAGLILHNPVAMRQIILRQFGWWNLWLFAGPMAQKIPRALDSVANARASHVPVIFLLAENDEVIAPRFQRLVVEAYAGEKRLIPLSGAHHNDPIEGTSLADFHRALDWLVPRNSTQN